jgi:hypothetical protein
VSVLDQHWAGVVPAGLHFPWKWMFGLDFSRKRRSRTSSLRAKLRLSDCSELRHLVHAIFRATSSYF